MQRIEEHLRGQGFQRIVGIDEAGRGPLAGCGGTVQILPARFGSEIRDSKALSPRKRELAYEEILRTCLVGVGQASPAEIDELNILQATFLAMRRAIEALPVEPDFCLVDGSLPIPGLSVPQRAVVKGDQLCLSIMRPAL